MIPCGLCGGVASNRPELNGRNARLCYLVTQASPFSGFEMTLLSLAVAALSVISLGVWWSTADVSALLLGVGGLLCAGATFKSARISTFVKIFIVIFATEVVVFGGLFLLSVVGLWPESLKAYKLPDSVALTVASRAPSRRSTACATSRRATCCARRSLPRLRWA